MQQKDASSLKQLCMGSLMAMAGWFICASFCLVLTLQLEIWPAAYDLALPVVLGVLFGNLAVFVFVPLRLKRNPKALLLAIIRICLAEGLLLFALYFAAKHFGGA